MDMKILAQLTKPKFCRKFKNKKVLIKIIQIALKRFRNILMRME